MRLLIQNAKVAKSKIHGWGVFASKDFRKGDTIEECPFIPSDAEENNPEKLQPYLFSGPTKRTTMIILGYGCVYNHAEHNNADYYSDDKKNVIVFHAVRPIKKGEEIFINYGRSYWEARRRNPK